MLHPALLHPGGRSTSDAASCSAPPGGRPTSDYASWSAPPGGRPTTAAAYCSAKPSSCSTSPLRGCSTDAAVTCSVSTCPLSGCSTAAASALLHLSAVPPPLLHSALLHPAAVPLPTATSCSAPHGGRSTLRCCILVLSTRRPSHHRSLICLTGFVQAHWKDDWYFGHQCLNGCNPLLLRQTHILPSNLSVTASMLHPFLPEGSSLQRELQEGRIYLLDYEVLDGVPANVVNGKQTYLLAPLCLLHLNQQSQLVPIAIQLQQNPGPQNPVFLPSDLTSDWLLAKVWVRASDFQCHQLVSYYLRTHVIGELCCVATLRQLPDLHPLHQTSLQINLQARTSLLAADGVFDKAMGSGLKTLPVLLSRASAKTTYRSLCIPDDLKDRGLDNLPQSYYTQDALKVWDALHSFVVSWVNVYDSRDDDIQLDSELQHWITDINTHGFTQLRFCFPQSFNTKAEVSKFVTMIIFSCSALHSAVNFSQVSQTQAHYRTTTIEIKITTTYQHVCPCVSIVTMLKTPQILFLCLCMYFSELCSLSW
uniref:Lipoxygenase domain-containing protein n=1 Tax=Amphiprion percula TaxID=161767 RepID=A0A3P8T0Z1_AMPPE